MLRHIFFWDFYAALYKEGQETLARALTHPQPNDEIEKRRPLKKEIVREQPARMENQLIRISSLFSIKISLRDHEIF